MHEYKGVSARSGYRRQCYGRMPSRRRLPTHRFNFHERVSPTHSPYASPRRSFSTPTLPFGNPDGTPSPSTCKRIEFRPPLFPSKIATEREEIPSSSTFVPIKSISSSRSRFGMEKENYSYNNYLLSRSQYREKRDSSSDSRTESASSSHSSDIDIKPGTVGLSNLGNTCFMNAALQCIAHVPSFLKYFLCNKYKDFKSQDDRLVESFAGVVRAIYQGSESSYTGHRGYSIASSRASSSFRPRDFLEQLIKVAPQFDGGRQHDCHEMIRVLIDQLSEDLCTSTNLHPSEPMLDSIPFLAAANSSWKQHIANNNSFITDEFCGQLVSTIKCSVCKTQRYTFDPFYDLSIPFPEPEDLPDDGDQIKARRFSVASHFVRELSPCSLDDCLHAYTKPEVLAGDNMTDCPKCKQKRESTKRLQVFRFPRVLVIHLKRFNNDKKKIKASVDFPLVGFDATALSMDNEEHQINAPVYDLFGTCEHSGRLNYGHYTATCLDPVSELWYHFNDSLVSRKDPENINKNAAYVLFYKQRA